VERWHAEGSKDAGNKEEAGNSHELRRVKEISERGQDFMSYGTDDDDDDDDDDVDDDDGNTIPQINVKIWPLSKM
jgi:hypothetical protein